MFWSFYRKMSEKKITIILLGLLLLLFGAYFSLQQLLLPAGQPLTGLFQDILMFSHNNQWPKAEKSALKLEKYWAKYKYLTSLNYAEEDYSLLKDTIIRIRSAVRAKDQAETAAHALACRELWKNFLKFIPEP
jgi:hypothetical protein